MTALRGGKVSATLPTLFIASSNSIGTGRILDIPRSARRSGSLPSAILGLLAMGESYADNATPFLDHVVILVPHDALTHVPDWLAKELTILPGGKHTGGITENKLVVFKDGSYLELIAFLPGVDPDERRKQVWGDKPEGTIIDFAYTLANEAQFNTVQDNVKASGAGIVYADPVPGGRIRPDGTELKWAVASAQSDSRSSTPVSIVRGDIPFWCLDRTPRRLRVPYDSEDNVRHPCGAVGIAGLKITTADEKVPALSRAYASIRGHQSLEVSEADFRNSWKVSPPAKTRNSARVSLGVRGDGRDHIRLSLLAQSGESDDGRSERVIRGTVGDRELEIEIISL